MNAIPPRRATTAAALVAAIVGISAAMAGQTLGGPERFEATAVSLDRGGTSALEITVNRWSTDDEGARLLTVLLDKGAGTLLRALQDNPTVGHIRTPAGGLGWDLHYARHTALPDGGEQVMLMTDRPISFREEASGARTLDYPFTIIELKVDADGQGEGTMSAAAKLSHEAGTIVVESWGAQPTLLKAVKRERDT